jgi:acetyl esterase
MAAVVSLMAKERKGPAFKAQLLFYPVTDAGMATLPTTSSPMAPG